MVSVVALLLLAAPQPIRVAAPGFTGVRVDEKEAAFYAVHLEQELARRGLRITSSREIQALVGLERQKQLLGCADTETSCIAELAGAMGADALLLGDIGRFNDLLQLNVRLLSTQNGAPWGNESVRGRTEEELLNTFPALADRLVASVERVLGRKLVIAAPFPWREVAGISALAAAVIPGVYGGIAATVYSRTADNQRQASAENRGVYEGDLRRLRITTAAGLGGAAALAGLGVYFLAGAGGPSEGSKDASVAVSVEPFGFSVRASFQ